MKVLNRRGFIKSAPIAAAAAVLPTAAMAFRGPINPAPEAPAAPSEMPEWWKRLTAQAEQADPHRGWFENWKRLRAEWMASEEGSAEAEALWAQTDDLERRLSATPAQTAQGACAQIEWMLADSTDSDFQYGHREALELAMGALKGGLV